MNSTVHLYNDLILAKYDRSEAKQVCFYKEQTVKQSEQTAFKRKHVKTDAESIPGSTPPCL
jgi:hypothetical protein